MLPFSLKVVWFCLSFTGAISCWVVICTFARAIQCYWILLYPVFATVLEGMFCLGMIYEMNPLRMPKFFCVFQTFVIYYSAWTLTGICAAFTFATSGSVLWPSFGTNSTVTTVAWKNRYYIPILVFPLVCLSISLPILLSMDAIQPTDDLHCDASHPEWGRFLGYGGLSMIICIPCLFLSAAAARRILLTHCRSFQRSRRSAKISTGPTRTRESREQNVPLEKPEIPRISLPDSQMSNSISPELLHSPQPTTATTIRADGECTSLSVDPDVSPSTSSDALASSPKPSEAWESMHEIEASGDIDPLSQAEAFTLSSITYDTPPPLPNLAPAIFRLVLFQIMFFFIECMASLSSIVDIVQRRPTPTPFGSQHVALILVGWGPAIVFAHLPSFRRELMCGRR